MDYADGDSTEPLDLLAIARDPDERRNKTFSVVRRLSADEDRTFRNATRHLVEFDTWDALMRIVEANYEAYREAVARCAIEATTKASKGQLNELLNHTINRALINVVTAFKLYLDHTSTRLSHRFGESSEAMKAYKRASSAAFDHSFAYRFMGQLRDYAVHCGFPITNITSSGRLDDAGVPVHQLSYSFDPKHLLESGPSYWRGKVKADLQSRELPIPVEPILAEAIDELRKINVVLVDREKPLLHEAARAILAIVRDVFAKDRVPAIGP